LSHHALTIHSLSSNRLVTCYIHYSHCCLPFVATGSPTCGQCEWRNTLVRTPLNS
jgi:hypothetical protein